MDYYSTHSYEFVCDQILDSEHTNIMPSSQQSAVLKALDSGARFISIKSGHGVGKALSLDSKLYTPSGYVLMKDIKEHDIVFDENGDTCKVKGVFPQPKQQMYKVLFSDGSFVRCSGDHRWTTYTREERKRNKQPQVHTTLEIKATLYHKNGKRLGVNHSVPLVKPVNFTKNIKNSVNPYILGAWLGDGSRKSITITKPYEPFKSFVNVNRDGLRKELKRTGLFNKYSYERFIPKDYLYSDIESRIKLLQGLLDTDGCINKKGSVFYSSTSERLKNDVTELVRSLGGHVCESKPKENPYYYKDSEKVYCRKCYCITINLPKTIIPFKFVTHKLERVIDKPESRYRRRFITNVIEDGFEKCQCIMVDSPSHLFLTDNFIPTHNSSLLAWVITWFLSTHGGSRIGCTSPTQHQLFDILWAELKKWYARITNPLIKSMLTLTATRFYCNSDPENWYAVARTSSSPEGLQGLHADHFMFIIDEASGVPENIFEVIEGALSTDGALCIMTGNPTQVSGTFFNSFHKDARFWKKFTFSCVDSENVDQTYVDRMKGKYGEDSDIYRVRVLGEFPRVASDTLIPLTYVETAFNNDFEKDAKKPIVIGIDVARYGNDYTEIGVAQGKKIIDWLTNSKQSTMETVGRCMIKINEYINEDIYVFIDDTGVGGGVTDRLIELTETMPNVTILGVNNGSRAIEAEKYKNRGAELWNLMKENIRDWSIPRNDDLQGQLTARKYEIESSGKIKMESKKDMKERGLPSPDKADCLSLTMIDPGYNGGGCILF